MSVLTGLHSYSSLCQRCCHCCCHCCHPIKSIFSGSCQPPPQGSLCGSWRQPLPCNRRDSYAYRSIGGCHRTGFHSDSRTLESHRREDRVRAGGFHIYNQYYSPHVPCSPVRPTLLRHMKHLFFLGLEVSPLLSSLLEEAIGAGLEAAGWFTTAYKKKTERRKDI